MGFFGTYLFDGVTWESCDADRVPQVAEPWLLLDIHDSDIGTVSYRPAGPGSGVAYLGSTPRTYFAREEASEPTDVAREAAGLAAWWERHHGPATVVAGAAKTTELVTYLAQDEDPYEDFDEDEDVDELDDAEIFVEVRAARFLAALDLPLPDELREIAR